MTKAKRRRRACRRRQLTFAEARPKSGRGGYREGAGRKPKGEKAGVPHRTRPTIPSGCPVHVTNTLLPDLPNLRKRTIYRKLYPVFCEVNQRWRGAFRIVHYSVQRNHIHLVCEVHGRRNLSRAMQSFKIRMVNVINTYLGRESGTVFADRYHERILRRPTHARNALAYVLLNGRRHGEDRGHPRPERWIDPFSSARYFDGWRESIESGAGPPAMDEEAPVRPPRSWLLKAGWRRGRGGLISILETPGPKPYAR
jgi:REP element-mobilizing transposase RayT